MVTTIAILVLFCGFLPDSSCSEHVPKTTEADGVQAGSLVAHLAAIESRIETKLVARFEEKLLARVEALAKSVKDAFDQRFDEIVARIDALRNVTEQQTAILRDLIQEKSIEHERTVIQITRAVRDEMNHLEYVVNHPDVFREAVWIPIQHRHDGSMDFQRNWTAYRTGFGSPRGEYWLGLEALYDVLRRHDHELLIMLEDFDGVIAHAHYSLFRIGGENERYAIKSVGEYSGTAGDALRLQEGAPFSTPPENGGDSSELNCATVQQAGWWYWKFPWCTKSNLNGRYSPEHTVACNMGFNWSSFRPCKYSLKSSKMLIRPSRP